MSAELNGGSLLARRAFAAEKQGKEEDNDKEEESGEGAGEKDSGGGFFSGFAQFKKDFAAEMEKDEERCCKTCGTRW